MGKHSVFLVVALALLLLLAGCGKAEQHVVINKNGSADMTITVEMDSSQITAKELLQSEQVKELKRKEFQITPYQSKQIEGFVAKKHFSNVKNMHIGNDYDKKTPEIIIEKSWFHTTYKVNGEWASNELEAISPIAVSRLHEAGEREMEKTFKLTMPEKIEGVHNATYLTDDGKTLIWEERFSSNGKITSEHTVTNWVSVVLTVTGIFLLLGIVVFLKKINS